VGAFGLLWLVFGWALPSQLSYSKSIRLESTRPPALTCTFIDVGHGTSVLVQDSVGQNLLYDCGSFGSSKWGAQNISGTLWAEGIVHLDAVILSHADVDHFNALPTLSRRFSIGAVYVSPQMLGSDSPAVHSVFRQLSERSIDVRTLLAGHGSCESGGLQVEVVAPTTAALGSTDNADSVVIRIEADGQSVMLPGDLEAESLVALLSRPENDCDVLMLAHHGSHNSLPEQWVAWSTPKVIVASCGRGRLRRDVADAMHESEGKFFRTDKDGAVRVTMSAGSIEVQTHSTGQWVNRGAE
jgi:competence protein ComEC